MQASGLNHPPDAGTLSNYNPNTKFLSKTEHNDNILKINGSFSSDQNKLAYTPMKPENRSHNINESKFKLETDLRDSKNNRFDSEMFKEVIKYDLDNNIEMATEEINPILDNSMPFKVKEQGGTYEYVSTFVNS